MESEMKLHQFQEQSDAMSQVYQDGLIKKNDQGGFVLVQDPNEQQYLQEKRSKSKRRGNINPNFNDDISLDRDVQEGDLE